MHPEVLILFCREIIDSEKSNIVFEIFTQGKWNHIWINLNDNNKFNMKYVLIIFRSYIDAQGKKKVNFSEKLNSKMSERPKSPVIKDMQHYILPKIEESFKSYIIVSIHANLKIGFFP